MAPVSYVAVVIAMVHGRGTVLCREVVGSWSRVLPRGRATPLAKCLLGTIRGVQGVAQHCWLPCRGHSHIKGTSVVLGRAGGEL